MANVQPTSVQLPPVPDSVEWAKFTTVVDLLGLPGHIRSLTIDANDGVTATFHPVDHDGRKIVYGDEALTITVNIPFTRA